MTRNQASKMIEIQTRKLELLISQNRPKITSTKQGYHQRIAAQMEAST